jgi:RNA polymerase sigma-70 factor (ECF subfamily)
MAQSDTSLGGEQRSFPATTLGFSGILKDERARDPARVVEAVCERYWKAVYSYLRIAWGKSNEEAKDLTQSFFLWLLEKEALGGYQPGRGGFRAFLKVLLRRFAGHAERDLHRQKRGGSVRVFSLEGEEPRLSPEAGPGRGADPEQEFDRTWLFEQVERATLRVRERCRAAGHENRFRLYEAHALGGESERPSYASLASRFGVTVGEVEKSLYLVREELRREIRRALEEEAGSEDEVDDEWRRLLGG